MLYSLCLDLDFGDLGGRHPKRRGRNKGAEGFGGHHEGVAEYAEVCPITHLFGEDVTWVDGTRNVVEVPLLCLDAVADGAVLEADVAHALGVVT